MTIENSQSSEVRETFRRAGEAIRAGAGLTPADQIAAGVRAIAADWNAKVPAAKVRILNQVRYYELADALANWKLSDILAGIDFYSRQQWNRTKGAWCTFDHFIQPQRLTSWIERALDAAEKEARKVKPADPKVAQLLRETGKAMGASGAKPLSWAQWVKLYEALPAGRRSELELAARGEIGKLRGPTYQPPPRAIQAQAITIAKRNGLLAAVTEVAEGAEVKK